MVRCKMVVTEVTEVFNQWGQEPGLDSRRVKLTAANGPTNKTWAKYTPSGMFELTINNPAAFGQFKPGEAFFVDFSPAPLNEAEEAK